MAPKRTISGESKSKRKNELMAIEQIKEIRDEYKEGARITNLAAEYCMVKSTVVTMLKNKEAIRGANVAMCEKKTT